MLPTDNPCYKCEERHMACHADCEKYKNWKAVIDSRKAGKEEYTKLSQYQRDAVLRSKSFARKH